MAFECSPLMVIRLMRALACSPHLGVLGRHHVAQSVGMMVGCLRFTLVVLAQWSTVPTTSQFIEIWI